MSSYFRGECLLELSQTLLTTYVNATFILFPKCLYFTNLALANYSRATLHKYFDVLSTSLWVRGNCIGKFGKMYPFASLRAL